MKKITFVAANFVLSWAILNGALYAQNVVTDWATIVQPRTQYACKSAGDSDGASRDGSNRCLRRGRGDRGWLPALCRRHHGTTGRRCSCRGGDRGVSHNPGSGGSFADPCARQCLSNVHGEHSGWSSKRRWSECRSSGGRRCRGSPLQRWHDQCRALRMQRQSGAGRRVRTRWRM